MAFWDDLQKGVSDAASFTAKKTSELTEKAKLKFNLHSEEMKLEKCFTRIGKLFYASEREGVDNTAEIATVIMQADKIKADINSYREQLSKLKNTSICAGCGAEIAEDSMFCPVCGLKQEPKDDCECSCEDCGAEQQDDTNEE